MPAEEVVFVKGLLEASHGVAALFAERGGELTLVAPLDRGVEFDELLADVEREFGVDAPAPLDRGSDPIRDSGA